MKKAMRLIVLLCMFLCTTISFAKAAGISAADLIQLCDDHGFTKGKYWSYKGKDGVNPGSMDEIDFVASDKKANTFTSTGKGKPGASGYYGYAYFDTKGGRYRECAGFAFYLGYKLTGEDPRYSDQWTRYTSFDKAGDLQVGDIVAIGYYKDEKRTSTSTHAAMVYSVSDGKYKFIQASGGSNNEIKRGTPFWVRAYDSAGKNISSYTSGNTINQLKYIQAGTYDHGIVVFRYNSKDEDNNTNAHYVSLSGTFSMTKAGNTKTEPYSSADNSGLYVKVGDKVSVTELVTNSYGNIWAKLSDGSYTCFADITKQETYMELVSLSTEFAATNEEKPTGELTKGKGSELAGTISGSAPMFSITARVINRSTGEDELKKVTAYPSRSATSAKIEKSINGVNINTSLKFGSLPVGYYTYQVTVQPGFKYKDTEYKLGTEKVVITSNFQVGKPSTPSPTYASLFNIRAGFKTTEKMTTRAEPFDGAASVKTLEKGTMFVVFKFFTNSEGDIWAQLDEATDNYVCFYDASKDKVMLDFVNVAQKTTVSGFPTSTSDKGYPGYPTGDREPKTSCALRGTITSVAPMLSIEARVTNLSTNKEVLSVTAKPKYDLRSAKINGDIINRDDGSKTDINDEMPFRQVTDDGYYVYEIAVQHGFVYEGKTFTFGDETVVFDSTFTVGDPEETLPDVPEPTKKPTGTQIGTTTKLPGDANDDGKVRLSDIMCIATYMYKDKTIEINFVNADMNNDGKLTLADIMRIAQILYGKPEIATI